MDWSAVVLSYLVSVTVRSLVLFAIAGVAMLVFRAKSAAARHAILTIVAGAMLLIAVLSPVLPPVPVRVLKAPVESALPADSPMLPALATIGAARAASTPARRLAWQDAAVAGYVLGALFLLVRLAYGYLFTRRLVRAATPIAGLEKVYASSWIAVPLTIGKRILLPEDWSSWDDRKLQAVLAHERTHVRRGDWAIALAAGLTRCLYWFHPLAWWLERRLATLAEQACDDSVLLLVESQPYAQALLDMAAAVKTAQGRVVWEAMAMAKAVEVRKRIERILDETRQIPRALTRTRWIAMLACSVPLVWLASVAQLAPAVAQDTPQTSAAMGEFLKGRRQLSPGDAAVMERYLTSNAHDIGVRTQLILYYYASGVREPRIQHILWLVANHPESTAAVFTSNGVLPRDNALNSAEEFRRVLEAWKRAAAEHKGETQVLANAARFLQSAGEFEEAERLLLDAGGLAQGPGMMNDQLGRLYAAAILGATGDSRFPNPGPAFAARARTQLDTSENGFLLYSAGSTLKAVAQRPQAGQPLPAGVLNLDDHPLLNTAIDLGYRLLARAAEKGVTPIRGGVVGGVPGGVNGGAVRGVPGGVVGGVIGGVPGGVVDGAIGGVPGGVSSRALTPASPPLSPAPPAINRPEPVYPQLALQARIEGVVKFTATIGTDGAVKHLAVVSGHPLLVPPALEAVKQCTFQAPAAEITSIIDVNFTLPPGSAPPLPPNTPRKNATPDLPMTIRVGGNVQSAMLIHRVDPVYPAQARAEAIEGGVTLQVTIGPDGQVAAAEPTDGNPILAAAAEEAVKQWGYKPTLLNGRPVTVITTVVVPFQLH